MRDRQATQHFGHVALVDHVQVKGFGLPASRAFAPLAVVLSISVSRVPEGRFGTAEGRDVPITGCIHGYRCFDPVEPETRTDEDAPNVPIQAETTTDQRVSEPSSPPVDYAVFVAQRLCYATVTFTPAPV